LISWLICLCFCYFKNWVACFVWCLSFICLKILKRIKNEKRSRWRGKKTCNMLIFSCYFWLMVICCCCCICPGFRVIFTFIYSLTRIYYSFKILFYVVADHLLHLLFHLSFWEGYPKKEEEDIYEISEVPYAAVKSYFKNDDISA